MKSQPLYAHYSKMPFVIGSLNYNTEDNFTDTTKTTVRGRLESFLVGVGDLVALAEVKER